MFVNMTRGLLAITSLSLALIPYPTFLSRKSCINSKHFSKHQGCQNALRVVNKIYFNIQGNP